MLVVLGCSGNSNPQSPDLIPDNLTADLLSGSFDSNRQLWGYYNLFFNEDGELEEILPLRAVADHWNVLYWLEYSPCTDCFRVTGVTPTPEGTLKLNIAIKHPFATPSLTGFDVRGIAMGSGSQNFPLAGLTTPNKFLGEAELVNADGFTTLYNATTAGSGPGGFQGYIQGTRATIPYPNATLNGFKRFASNPTAAGRNVFLAGQTISREFEIFKPFGSFIVGYAVDASWVPPTRKPVIDPIADFPPEANCYDPWRIDVTQEDIGDGLTATGGAVLLKLDVYDYQGKFSHGVPTVECPALFTGTVFATLKSSEIDHTKFEVELENINHPAESKYKALIRIEDSENANSPSWLDLTAYHIVDLSVGMLEPENVDNFQASDEDPSLDDRRVLLTWDTSDDTIAWYDIERLDWNSGSASWQWNGVKSIAYPATSWLDGTPRYSGTKNPIEYRIRGRNAYGISANYSTDTGYPKPRTFGMALWCVADDSSGNGAVTSWSRAMNDFQDTNLFWNQYGMEFVLENSDNFHWITNAAYKNVNGDEAGSMHNNYGKPNTPDSVNVYYVNAAHGSTNMAFCMAMCPGNKHTTKNIYIVMARDSSDNMPITLPHECGHAIGHFFDVYELDPNGNMKLDDGATCANTNNFCNQAPYTPPLFCDIAAAYAEEPNAWPKTWDLMWYSAPGKPLTKYDLTASQYVYLSDWLATHKNQYPFP